MRVLAQGGAIFGTELFCQGSYPGWMYLLLGCAKLLAISISVCAGVLLAESDVLQDPQRFCNLNMIGVKSFSIFSSMKMQ